MRIPARVVWWLLGVLATLAAAPEKPLTRSFSTGEAGRYCVQLTVRSEIEGQQPVPIGAKAYVKPFLRSVETRLAWTATQRIQSVGPDGIAEVEETLDAFQASAEKVGPTDEETQELSKIQRAALDGWKQSRTLHYREAPSGQTLAVKSDGAPSLSEASSPLLTLWLLRALRPAVALPATPVRFGLPWREPRTVQIPNWAGVRGSETGEWLEELESSEPAARLHIVQEISGTVEAGPENPPEGAAQARFHSESLNTVSLMDGRLLAATRSATREVTWTLAPVEGLRERPQFRGRLSVEVQIEPCDEDPCLSAERSAVRRRR